MVENSNFKDNENFRSESLLMMKLRPHLNVLQFIGTCCQFENLSLLSQSLLHEEVYMTLFELQLKKKESHMECIIL